MKKYIITIITAFLLTLLLTLYSMFNGSDLMSIIVNPLNLCGLLLGVVNISLLNLKIIQRVLVSSILGVIIFSLILYLFNSEFSINYLIIGAIIGTLTPYISNFFINKFSVSA